MSFPDPIFTCAYCEDIHWLRVEIPDKDRKEGSATHYMIPCERCLPERYEVMIRQNHIEVSHMERGGCNLCKKYVQPWTLKK